MTDTPSIVYMGTPEFAVPTFKALHDSPFHLKGVITQPDRPKGRGRRMAPPPVKEAAMELGYDVLQPEDIRAESSMRHLHRLSPDYLVVVAYGQILPASVLAIPRRGAVNVHASLLPKYRGPAPIQWAIMRGEDKTGVTTMLMDHGVDTGDMLLTTETPIEITDTAATLHDRLSQLGAELLVQTIEGLSNGRVFPKAQKHNEATYAPMLTKENGRIQWKTSAKSIDAHIRAMTPWPGAWCMFGDKRFKIHRAAIVESSVQSPPGTVVPGFPDEVRIASGDGVLALLEIQGASGKRMPIRDFLRGHPISAGEIFT